MRILSIGLTTYDITFYTDCYPPANRKIRNNDKAEAPGGSAFNMTALLNKWGVDVSLLSVIGNDIYASNIIKYFQEQNIDETYLQKNDGNTNLSSVVCNLKEGTRNIVAYQDPSLRPNDPDLDFNPDLIITDGHYPEIVKSVINKYPQAVVLIDAGRFNEETVMLAKLAHYMICSKDFAEEYTGIDIDLSNRDNIMNIFNKLKEEFKNTNIITLEKSGSIVENNNQIYLVPSIKVEELDTNGAGDLYHGAFAYGLIQKWPLSKIMMVANITGALSTTAKGNYIPSIEEVLRIYDNQTQSIS